MDIEPGNIHHSDSVVVKDGWNIFRRELIGSVGYQQTRFSDGSVTNHHTSGKLLEYDQIKGHREQKWITHLMVGVVPDPVLEDDISGREI